MINETYQRKPLIWDSQLQRVRAHDFHGREHGSWNGARAREKAYS